jgi:hypothetical protein
MSSWGFTKRAGLVGYYSCETAFALKIGRRADEVVQGELRQDSLAGVFCAGLPGLYCLQPRLCEQDR